MRSLSAHRWLAAFVVLALYAVAPRSGAEVVTLNGATWLKGEILPRDLQVLRERKREGMVVNLNTGGGQVTSAIAIGRMLRQTKRRRQGRSGFLLTECLRLCAGGCTLPRSAGWGGGRHPQALRPE